MIMDRQPAPFKLFRPPALMADDRRSGEEAGPFLLNGEGRKPLVIRVGRFDQQLLAMQNRAIALCQVATHTCAPPIEIDSQGGSKARVSAFAKTLIVQQGDSTPLR